MIDEAIKVLIIEDEDVWRKFLTVKLDQLGYEIAGEASTFEDGIKLLATAEYDLVLLDINLNSRGSGIELAHVVNQLYKKPFIFITFTMDTMIADEAAATNPSAYLQKPVNATSLRVAIQNALRRFSDPDPGPFVHSTTEQDYFFVKQGNNYKKLDWKDIVHMRSNKNYTLLYSAADKKEYAIRSSLSRTHQLILPDQYKNDFIQVNRSEIVHFSFIEELRGEDLRTNYGIYVVTEGYLDQLKNRMKILS